MKTAHEDIIREALDSMVDQFAYRSLRKRGKWYQLTLHTAGLSALEQAFDAFGWRDPHIVKNPSPADIAAQEYSDHVAPGLGHCGAILPMKRRWPPGKGKCLRYNGHPDFHIDYQGKRWPAP